MMSKRSQHEFAVEAASEALRRSLDTEIARALKDRAEKAEARAAKLQEALEFYADPDIYFAIGFFPDPPCGEFIEDISNISGLPDDHQYAVFKPGKRARDILDSLILGEQE